MLYFGYGSNLDTENWADWCNAKGYDPASIECLGPAWLPDYEPVFHYQSRLRKGGALDVQPRRGTATPGGLFRVHDWAGLDAKEGVSGGFYRPIEVTVLTDDGHAHGATTYTVCEQRVQSYVAPGDAYLECVRRGLRRFGHPDAQLMAAAEGQNIPAQPRALFVYGTLMQGGSTHGLVQSHVGAAEHPATVHGASLVHVDWYPGLILSAEGSVHGQLFELGDPTAALEDLDPYEDFIGYGHPDSLYRRSLVRAHTQRRSVLAWTYVFLGDHEGLARVESGRWHAS